MSDCKVRVKAEALMPHGAASREEDFLLLAILLFLIEDLILEVRAAKSINSVEISTKTTSTIIFIVTLIKLIINLPSFHTTGGQATN